MKHTPMKVALLVAVLPVMVVMGASAARSSEAPDRKDKITPRVFPV